MAMAGTLDHTDVLRTLELADIRQCMKPIDYFHFLYEVLGFYAYPFLEEHDVYIKVTLFENDSGLVELIPKKSNTLLPWRYLEGISKYISF